MFRHPFTYPHYPPISNRIPGDLVPGPMVACFRMSRKGAKVPRITAKGSETAIRRRTRIARQRPVENWDWSWDEYQTNNWWLDNSIPVLYKRDALYYEPSRRGYAWYQSRWAEAMRLAEMEARDTVFVLCPEADHVQRCMLLWYGATIPSYQDIAIQIGLKPSQWRQVTTRIKRGEEHIKSIRDRSVSLSLRAALNVWEWNPRNCREVELPVPTKLAGEFGPVKVWFHDRDHFMTRQTLNATPNGPELELSGNIDQYHAWAQCYVNNLYIGATCRPTPLPNQETR